MCGRNTLIHSSPECVCVYFILGGKRMRHIDFHFGISMYPAPQKAELQKETPKLPTNFAGMRNAICNIELPIFSYVHLKLSPMGWKSGRSFGILYLKNPNCNRTKNNQRNLIIATAIQQIGIVSFVMHCLFLSLSISLSLFSFLFLSLSLSVCVNHRVAQASIFVCIYEQNKHIFAWNIRKQINELYGDLNGFQYNSQGALIVRIYSHALQIRLACFLHYSQKLFQISLDYLLSGKSYELWKTESTKLIYHLKIDK